MKLWPVVALAAMSSSLVWACQADPVDGDGGGGEGGEATGGTGTGGAGTGGAGTGGAGTGGSLGGGGGVLICDPEEGSEALGGAGGVGGAGTVEIFGDWSDQYGSLYSFDAEVIETGYTTYDVEVISDGGQFIVAQNRADASYFPCLYSRFDWTEDSGTYYLCRTVLGADSVEDALALPAADRTDLSTGCSGFPWSQLSAE